MKIFKKLLLGMLVFALLSTTKTYGQEEEFKSVFITVTTSHRTSDPDVDTSDWFKTEKEYFDKVTSKNDLIIGSGYYFHYFTPNDSEVLTVNVYANWEDIENAGDVTDKLVEEGWPDEDARKAFLKKQNSYYAAKHSDEIYVSLPFTKPVNTESKKPLIYYVKKNVVGSGGSGFKEYFENVTMKNDYIKGYFTHRHRWGSDSRDAMEVFVYESLADLESAFEEDEKLTNEHWPDADKRKEFFKGFSKIFRGHGDYIYSNVPELEK